jgi:hypothetical protein
MKVSAKQARCGLRTVSHGKAIEKLIYGREASSSAISAGAGRRHFYVAALPISTENYRYDP